MVDLDLSFDFSNLILRLREDGQGGYVFDGEIIPISSAVDPGPVPIPDPEPEPDPVPDPDPVIDFPPEEVEPVIPPVLPGGDAPLVGKFVSTTGNNANPGTELSPWLTLQYAFDNIANGETLWMRGGTYAERVHAEIVASAESPVIIRNYPGEIPILDSSGIGGENALYFFPWVATRPARGGAYVTIRGLEIANSEITGLKMENCESMTILDCNIHDNIGNGIFGFMRNCLVSHNTIRANGNTGLNHGMYVYGSNNTYEYNLISLSQGFNIQYVGGDMDAALYPSSDYRFADNVVFRKNVIANSVGKGGVTVWPDSANPGPITNTMWEDNIFYQNDDSLGEPNALSVASANLATDTIRNCLFYRPANTLHLDVSDGLRATHDISEMTQTDNVSNQDPDFVDEIAFALNAGSPAIGAGLNGGDIGRYN